MCYIAQNASPRRTEQERDLELDFDVYQQSRDVLVDPRSRTVGFRSLAVCGSPYGRSAEARKPSGGISLDLCFRIVPDLDRGRNIVHRLALSCPS